MVYIYIAIYIMGNEVALFFTHSPKLDFIITLLWFKSIYWGKKVDYNYHFILHCLDY